jgi:uncharacterized membrane protein
VASRRFNIGTGQKSQSLLLTVPKHAAPGNYAVRVTVSTDTTRRTVFRELQVI